MSDFTIAIQYVLNNEGGFENLSSDTGNYDKEGNLIGTNFGISAKTFENYLGYEPTPEQMQNMTQATAIDVYEKLFWNPYNLDLITDQYLASHILDIIVLSGFTEGSKIIQKAVNDCGGNIIVDGSLGQNTINAINNLTNQGQAETLNSNLVTESENYYQSLGQSDFIQGWINRAQGWLNYSGVASYSSLIALLSIGILFVILFNKR